MHILSLSAHEMTDLCCFVGPLNDKVLDYLLERIKLKPSSDKRMISLVRSLNRERSNSELDLRGWRDKQLTLHESSQVTEELCNALLEVHMADLEAYIRWGEFVEMTTRPMFSVSPWFINNSLYINLLNIIDKLEIIIKHLHLIH